MLCVPTPCQAVPAKETRRRQIGSIERHAAKHGIFSRKGVVHADLAIVHAFGLVIVVRVTVRSDVWQRVKEYEWLHYGIYSAGRRRTAAGTIVVRAREIEGRRGARVAALGQAQDRRAGSAAEVRVTGIRQRVNGIRYALNLADALIHSIKEGLVLLDRTAKRAAEIVSDQFRLGHREIAPGIQIVIAEIIECISVELIRSALARDHNLAAHADAVLSAKGVRDHAEFLDAVHAERGADRVGSGTQNVHHRRAVEGNEVRPNRRSVGAEIVGFKEGRSCCREHSLRLAAKEPDR